MVSGRIVAAVGIRLLSGGATASRSGRIPISSPTSGRITATARRRRARLSRRWRRSSASRPIWRFPPTRTSGIICGRSGGCRRTSIRSNRSSMIPKSERGWPASFNRAWTASSATLCRFAASEPPRDLAGRAVRGSSAASTCSCIPGDSPMGFRLPLDSLPWSAPADQQFAEPVDPFAPREPLPTATEIARQQRAATKVEWPGLRPKGSPSGVAMAGRPPTSPSQLPVARRAMRNRRLPALVAHARRRRSD